MATGERGKTNGEGGEAEWIKALLEVECRDLLLGG